MFFCGDLKTCQECGFLSAFILHFPWLNIISGAWRRQNLQTRSEPVFFVVVLTILLIKAHL